MDKTEVKKAIKDIFWMARRYANGRHTYAPSMFNNAYDILRDAIPDLDDNVALDMNNNVYYDISIEHTKEHPYALDTYEDVENNDIKNRPYYLKPKIKS